ncbi:MAG TPA: hypothetical protein VGM88_08870, partial [Kofleriaceae bacterium]
MGAPDIDLMIEDGLSRYGRGDLDGALDVWEEVLAIDPGNEQAASYVDYVRHNYDMLTGEAEAADESGSPYAIDDDEYLVEISEGRMSNPAITVPPDDPMDEGWSIDGEEPAAARDSGAHAAVKEFTDTPSNPVFNTDPTNVKKRDLGFVSPSKGVRAETVTQEEPRPRADSAPPELHMSLRTPEGRSPAVADALNALSDETQPEARPLGRDPNRETSPLRMEQIRGDIIGGGMDIPDGMQEPPDLGSAPDISVFAPQHTEPGIPPGPSPAASSPTVPPPMIPRPPQLPTTPPPGTSDDPNAFGPMPTRELVARHNIAMTSAPTTELPTGRAMPIEARPTRQMEPLEKPGVDRSKETTRLPALRQNQLVVQSMGDDIPLAPGAPTRELGVRPNVVTSEMRAKLLTNNPPVGTNIPPEDRTRTDVPLMQFDAIEARNARILDDIEDGASAAEPKEDRTRRRITTLLERAAVDLLEDLAGARVDRIERQHDVGPRPAVQPEDLRGIERRLRAGRLVLG